MVTCRARALIDAVFAHTKTSETTLARHPQASMRPTYSSRPIETSMPPQSPNASIIRVPTSSPAQRQSVLTSRPDGAFSTCVGSVQVGIIAAKVILTTGQTPEEHSYRRATTLSISLGCGSFTSAFEAANDQGNLTGRHIHKSAIVHIETIGAAHLFAEPLPPGRFRVCPSA